MAEVVILAPLDPGSYLTSISAKTIYPNNSRGPVLMAMGSFKHHFCENSTTLIDGQSSFYILAPCCV